MIFLGVNYVKPVVVKSLFRNEEFELALKLGQSLGVEVLETEMSELQDANIVKIRLKVGTIASA